VTLPPFGGNEGPYVDADPGGYQVLLDYRDGKSPFQTVTLKELLAGNVPPATFHDRIVIVGVSAESVKDRFFTPFSGEIGQGGAVSGAMIHGYLASQLLRAALEGEAPLKFMTEPLETGWVVLWGVLGYMAGLMVRAFVRLSAVMLLGIAVISVVVYFAFLHGWWLPAIPAGASWLLSAGLMTAYLSGYERLQRGELMQLFAKHVSADIAEEIWRRRDQYVQSGRLRSNRQTVTVLFTDIEHFTTVSEKLGPEVLMDWLNEYMEIMADLVIRSGGVVDDYHGDAIKANFGVPIMRTSGEEVRRDAENAVRCALEMAKALEDYNRVCRARGMPHLRMRIGISTGEVVAGCLGSSRRMKYTTIGDTVNTAARLETLDKESFDTDRETSDCRILVSESTLALVGDLVTAKPVGSVVLRGKTRSIQVFRLDDTEIKGDVALEVNEVMA
jgi:adenylate cyclase